MSSGPPLDETRVRPSPPAGLTQAVILAGGFGTRLRPAVPDLPKVMAPVAGRPFLEHLLTKLKAQGISRVVLCLGYRAEEIAGYFHAGEHLGLDISYSVESVPLGTGGALEAAAPRLLPAFLLINGDTALDIDIGDLYRYHCARGGQITMVGLRWRGRPRQDTGYAVAGRGGRVLDLVRGAVPARVVGPHSVWACCGWYVCERSLIERALPAGASRDRTYSFEAGFVAPLLGSVYVYPTDAPYWDIGTPERYRRLREEWERRDRGPS